MEAILKNEPSIAHYLVNIGGFEGGETNKGVSFISLKDRGERQESQQQVMDSIRNEIQKRIPKDFTAVLINPSNSFGGAKTGHELSNLACAAAIMRC